MRIIDLGDTFTEHFPQFEIDQVTKRSGLTDFATTVWEGAVESAVVATVTEIGTSGEYAVSFVPSSVGVWSLEVHGLDTGDRYTANAVVALPVLAWGLTAAEGATDATWAVWLERDGARLTDFESVAAVIRASDGTEVADLGTVSSDTDDGLFIFTCEASALEADREYYLDCAATRAGVTWYNNLGFTKV